MTQQGKYLILNSRLPRVELKVGGVDEQHGEEVLVDRQVGVEGVRDGQDYIRSGKTLELNVERGLIINGNIESLLCYKVERSGKFSRAINVRFTWGQILPTYILS